MSSRFLLYMQGLAHLGLAFALVHFNWTDWLVVFAMYFVGGCLGVSMTFHRFLSHRSWAAPPWWQYVGSLCGTMFLVGSPLAWSNNHISHHKHVDTEKDPHSPAVKGVATVQWLSMLTSEQSFRYSVRNVSPFQTFLHRHYVHIHLVYLFTLLLLGGVKLALLVYLVPSAVVWNMGSLINTINHLSLPINYRWFKTGKAIGNSQNNIFTGWLVWGEGWHNNHHAYPGLPNFGRSWWEFDISYWIIKLVENKYEQKRRT